MNKPSIARITAFIVAAGILALSAALPAQPSLPRAEQITRFTKAYPALSPGGERLAYMSNADGDFDIYVLRPGTREVRQLTDSPGRDGTPAWSPDGKMIAFQSFRDGNSQVYVMNADGSGVRNLSRNTAHEEHPVWSSDGSRLLFCSNRDGIAEGDSANMDIYRMNADGSGVRRITRSAAVETYASWSPDQSRIVCRQIRPDGDWEVVAMNADGTGMENLTRHKGVDGWPVWSPDGTHIAYASETEGAIRLFMMRADGSGRIRLSDDDSGGDRQPCWKPDGSWLFFSRYHWFPGSAWYESADIFALPVPAAALK